MKRIILLLTAFLTVQPIRAQSSDDFPDATDRATDVPYAPVYVFTNGPGRIYIFERGQTVVDGQMLPVGSRFLLVAVPDPGYQFVSWYPVDVFTFTEVILDSQGNPDTTNNSVVLSPVPMPVDRRILDSELRPVIVLFDEPGVKVITEGFGWQANFEPIPPPRRRLSPAEEHQRDNQP